MSKRKDRLYTNWRSCPICAGKNIFVWKSKKLFCKEKTYIYCYKCEKDVQVVAWDREKKKCRKVGAE